MICTFLEVFLQHNNRKVVWLTVRKGRGHICMHKLLSTLVSLQGLEGLKTVVAVPCKKEAKQGWVARFSLFVAL